MAGKGLSAERAAELDAALREMIAALSGREVPSRVLSVIDQVYHEDPARRAAAPKRRP